MPAAVRFLSCEPLIGPLEVDLSGIGWVIVGGMSFGTLLTLLVVPTAYSLLAKRERKKRDEAPAVATAPLAHPQPGAAD